MVISPLKLCGEKLPLSSRASAAARPAQLCSDRLGPGGGLYSLFERTKSGSLKVSLSRPSVLDMAGWVMDIRRAARKRFFHQTCIETNRLRSIFDSFFSSIIPSMPWL